LNDAVGVEGFPDAKGQVLDAVVRFRPALLPEAGQRGGRGIEADHSLVVRDGDEQRTVGVAVSQDGIYFENRPGRIPFVDAHAVVDDSLEHGQRTDAQFSYGSLVAPSLASLRPYGTMMLDG
jgi:hypothetical protein